MDKITPCTPEGTPSPEPTMSERELNLHLTCLGLAEIVVKQTEELNTLKKRIQDLESQIDQTSLAIIDSQFNPNRPN